MTVFDLFAVCRRRWAWLLSLLAIGALVTLQFVLRPAGVYTAEVDAIFLAPPTALHPNSLQSTSASLISMAGIVERQINGDGDSPRTASETVTLADEGVGDGTTIELPNSGGQWAYNFGDPMLTIDAVGPSQQSVTKKIDVAMKEVARVLAKWQIDAGVAPENMIRIQESPAAPRVVFVDGHRGRALTVSVLLVVALSVSVCLLVDRRYLRRAGRSAEGTGRGGGLA